MSAKVSQKKIATQIANSNGLTTSDLGLRFDKVVVGLFESLGSCVEESVSPAITVLVAITAPIRLPAKTAAAIQERIRISIEAGRLGEDFTAKINGNKVRLRLVSSSSKHTQKFIGFVHNSSIASKRILNLATKWLGVEN